MATKTLGQRLESLQASIERSELALENSVASEHNVKRESLEALYKQEKYLIRQIDEKGWDWSPKTSSTKSPRRGYVQFS